MPNCSVTNKGKPNSSDMARSKYARNLSREEKIKVVRKGTARYLFNASGVGVERLRYQTGAMGEGYVSSVVTYEVRDLPPDAAAQIETVDPYEDGFILWQITEIDWADGQAFEGLQNVTESRGWGGKEHDFVEREKEQIGEPTPPRTFEDESDEPSAES